MKFIGSLLAGAGFLHVFVLVPFAPTLRAQDVAAAPLVVSVLQGDGVANGQKHPEAQQLIVRVEMSGHRAASGALVSFAAPNDGPGGVFLDGLKSLQVTSDKTGVAVANGFRPNASDGSFSIRVTALWQGQTGYATIHQTNIVPRAALGLSKRGWWILGAVAVAGAAGGAVAATHHGSGSSSTTITAGGVTVGAPQ